MQGLALGRVVIYVDADQTHAAIISEIHDREIGNVQIHVFVPTGVKVERYVLYNENDAPHSWHWPPRV